MSIKIYKTPLTNYSCGSQNRYLQLTTLKSNKSEAKKITLRKYVIPALQQINNQQIQWNIKDNSVKYLGVYLDKRLTWKTLNQ